MNYGTTGGGAVAAGAGASQLAMTGPGELNVVFLVLSLVLIGAGAVMLAFSRRRNRRDGLNAGV